jgi:hypothetical protein
MLVASLFRRRRESGVETCRDDEVVAVYESIPLEVESGEDVGGDDDVVVPAEEYDDKPRSLVVARLGDLTHSVELFLFGGVA